MPVDDILLEAEDKMEKQAAHLSAELKGIRTGRATPALVEHIKVNYYGAPTDLRQIAQIAVPEPTQISIKPFQPDVIKDIEKALLQANLGSAPTSDGKIVRVNIPPLSEERRKTLASQVKNLGEQSKIVLRNIRRDAIKTIDREKKDGILPEDDAKNCKDEIQSLIDKFEKKVNEIVDAKTEEITKL